MMGFPGKFAYYVFREFTVYVVLVRTETCQRICHEGVL